MLILVSLILIYNDQGTIVVTSVEGWIIYGRWPHRVINIDSYWEEVDKYIDSHIKVGSHYRLVPWGNDIYIGRYKLSELVKVDVEWQACRQFSSLKDRCPW